MKNTYKIFFLSFVFIVINSGCVNDLDTVPLDPDLITSGNVYDDPAVYEQVLAKLYAGLAVSGQQGPAGNEDIGGIDEGFGQYLRAFWYHQELPTDEAVIGWNDQTISDFHDLDWTSGDIFIAAFYSRIFYQVSLCNEFLRQTTEDLLDERGVEQALKDEIAGFRNEARFLRALSYWHALDHFRNVPFTTEEDAIGSDVPEQANPQEVFDFIESELLAIEPLIVEARSNEYGRADRGAVWALLAKLYLNAEVYINTPRYADCLTYCENLLNAGYTLEEDYQKLFLADNNTSGEIIFPVTFDGINTRTWGGTTFIIRAGLGGSADPIESGVTSGWAGTRITPQVVNLFGDIGGIISDFAPKTNLPQVFIAGDHQGNVIDADYGINSINSDRVNEGFQYFEAGNTFVVARIPSLASALGDNDGDGILETGGAPIEIPETGLYYLKVDLNDLSYEATKVELIATGSAVSSEVAFTWDRETRLARAEFTLSPGEFSIRVDGAGLALGDANADGYLTFEESGLPIDYTEPVEVVLDISKQAFTYQINSTSFDRRGIFYTEGQSLEIEDINEFEDGYAVTKFKNVTSDGTIGSDTEHADTDFPMFRLGDVYLMAAEAILRNGGSTAQAAEYVNAVRERAYKGSAANVSAAELDLNFIIEERARELYWEAHRRTDLVRFNLLTTDDYLWDWKGGVRNGQGVESFRRVFPIPATDLNTNPNLVQNEGY